MIYKDKTAAAKYVTSVVGMFQASNSAAPTGRCGPRSLMAAVQLKYSEIYDL